MGARVRCKNCGDVLESKDRHDMVKCSCFRNAVDNKGIFIDGGDEYCRYGGCMESVEWLSDDIIDLFTKD